MLTIEDVRTIFQSEYCNSRHAEGDGNSLVFALELRRGIRTPEPHRLLVSNLRAEHVGGHNAFVDHPSVGAVDGEFRNGTSGMKPIKNRAKSTPIYDINVLDGPPNIHTVVRYRNTCS